MFRLISGLVEAALDAQASTRPVNMTRVNPVGKIYARLGPFFSREDAMKINCKLIFGALIVGVAGAAFAQDALPPAQDFDGVSFITGGIGLDESTAMKAAEKDFTLSLLFAQTKRGEYLSDIRVSVRDKTGKIVLEADSDGPMLLARLPAGVYKVSADHEGSVLVKTVRVDPKGVTRVAFVWQATAKATID